VRYQINQVNTASDNMWMLSNNKSAPCNRYTYGQPVRGRAAVEVSIQPYSRYDRGRYGLKRMNVEVGVTAATSVCCTKLNTYYTYNCHILATFAV